MLLRFARLAGIFVLAFAAAAPVLAQDAAAMKTLRNDVVIGQAGAPHALDLYVSYTCPHCRDYWTSELPMVESDLVKAGKLRINVRPAIFNTVDLIVSMAVGCLAETKRETFVTQVYSDQPDMMTNAREGKLGTFILERLAAQGVDEPTAKACLSDESRAQTILEGYETATKAVLPQMQAMYNDECRARSGKDCEGIMTPLHVFDGKLISGGGLAELKSLIAAPNSGAGGKRSD